MPIYDYAILVVGIIAWGIPYLLLAGKRRGHAAQMDRRARVGIFLQMCAYAVPWQNNFWTHPPAGWRVVLSIVFHILAAIVSWSAARTLGKQWRFDAGVNADHQLVQTGIYGIVRHPIYTAMLCLMLGEAFMVATWPLLIAATALMLLGTEIRVRIEERLLRERFTTQHDAYRKRVGAYMPRPWSFS